MSELTGPVLGITMVLTAASLGSTYVNLFNKFNQSFQVRLQSGADYRRQLQDIGNLYVPNQPGQMVPLGS